MWVLWTLFDGRRVYTEREVNEVLKAANAFGDHATLLRSIRDKVLPLGDHFVFLPGHGAHSSFAQERRTNPYVSDAALA